MDESTPKISVCLPVWNGEQFLEAALNSLVSQSFEDFEIIISNDNSDDSSSQIIESFVKAEKRITVLPSTKRCGLFRNYNRCLLAAKAPIIKFFAQDDLLHTDALATIYETFQTNHSISLISLGKELIDASGAALRQIKVSTVHDYFPELNAKPIDGVLVASKILSTGENFIGEPAAVAIRRSAAGDGFDPSFTHVGDLEYWLRILLSSSMMHIDQKLYSFRIHDDSQSKRNTDSLFTVSDTLRMARKHETLCRSLNIDISKQLREFTAGLAGQVFSQHQKAPIDLEDMRSQKKLLEELSEIPNKELLDSATDELILFRELSYHALMALGETHDRYRSNLHESSKIMKREQQITVLEYEMGQLLSSMSWKSTRPLREFNSKLFGLVANDNPISRNLDDNEDNLAAIASRQESYLAYLRQLRAAILASRSWKITAPLRFLSGAQVQKLPKEI